MSTALVFTGGNPAPAAVAADLPAADVVVAADSGLELAQTLGCRVDVAVGDFDSVAPAALAAAERAGTVVHRHPTAKDATDLELALEVACRRARRVTVVGGDGGRLDHLLGVALLLAAPAYAHVELTARLGLARVAVIRARATLVGRPGALLSLLPAHGPAHGVRTAGLRYPLHAETLPPGTTRGLSNEFTAPTAEVSLTSGVLLAVAPGPNEESA